MNYYHNKGLKRMFLFKHADSSVMFNGTMSSLKLKKNTDTLLDQGTKAAILNITGPKPNSI